MSYAAVDKPRYQRAIGGALFIAFGTGAALLSIPGDFQNEGAMLFTAVAMALALLAPLVFSDVRDIRGLLRGENILLLALVYWVLFEMLQGAFVVKSSLDSVERQLVLLGVTGAGFWLGANLWPSWRPRILFEESHAVWSETTIFVLIVVASVLGAWDFLYRAGFDLGLVAESLLLPRFEAPWQREQLGDWSAFSAHMVFFGYTVPALTMLLAVRHGFARPYTLISYALTLAIVVLNSQGGGRRIVGVLLLSAVFCWLIDRRRLTMQRAVVLGAALFALLVVLQYMLLYRNVGFGELGTPMEGWGYFHVDGNFLVIAQLLEFVPETFPFVGWQYAFWAIVRPIPRVLWPGKPVDGGFDLAEVLGVPHTTVAISIAGELYLSYGYLAAFAGGLIYGRFGSLVNGLLEVGRPDLNPVFPSLLLVWLFVGVRSMLEIMLLGYVLLAILLLARTSRWLAALRRSVRAT